jgi:hypothetical protein
MLELGNQQPYRSLFQWLSNTSIGLPIHRECDKQIVDLSDTLDSSGCGQKPSAEVGLELDHDKQNKVDISIFGDRSLLNIPNIGYPVFAKKWDAHIRSNALERAFPDDLVVEFDYRTSGYKLMGFFQNCMHDHLDSATVMDALQYYASSRVDEMGPSALVEPNKIEQSMLMLKNIVDTLGPPKFIGFVDRDMLAVKLVIPIEFGNLMQTLTFCSEYLLKQPVAAFPDSPARLREVLDAMLQGDRRPRISLDFDIGKACLLKRLSIEFMSTSFSGASSANTSYASCQDEARLLSHLDGYAQSLEVRSKLPYGARRPTPNMLGEEVMTLHHVHSKLMLSEQKSAIKDYVIVRYKRKA